MREIIDTWNIIEKYNIKGWKQEKGAIYIPTKEFDRVYEEILNKSYLRNLLKKMKVHPPINIVPQNRLRSVTSPTKLLKIVADKVKIVAVLIRKCIIQSINKKKYWHFVKNEYCWVHNFLKILK